jgi:hypothetical protein
MADKIWNGGKTNESKEKAIRDWNKMIRDSEDYFDTIDSEKEFREDLKERQKIMDKTRIEKKPMHELYNNIDYSERTKISGMGGVGGPIDVVRSQANKSKEKSS